MFTASNAQPSHLTDQLQDTPQLPMLLALALPHLPPPIPSLTTNGLAYLKIGSVFLDDIAGLLVGIGLMIWVASWLAG